PPSPGFGGALRPLGVRFGPEHPDGRLSVHVRPPTSRERPVVLDRGSRLSRRAVLARSLALAAVSSVAARLSSAEAATRVTVALDWYPNANHAGLFLARERGYAAAAGLEAELYTPADPATVLQTVGAGQDTFGISYQTDILLARAQGVPVVSVAALVQRPLLGIMSLAGRGIGRPRDLVGKTVGYPGIPSQEAFLATMLEADGARLNDVELVDVDFALVPAVVSARVDAVMGAYWTHETILAEREGHPVNLMRVEEWGVPAYYELVLAASERTVAGDPETVRAVLAAAQRGYAEAAVEQGAALDALAAASPELDRAVEAEGLALLAPAWTEGVPAFGTQDPERWRAYAAWMAGRGLIPAELDPGSAFTTALLPAASGVVAAASPLS
ncbi:MAG: ABC transporter substrate-binding protein, partial [Chloroflexota bacterium]|nr:ABC transporter substrate-binding protein [Chloroflexota bacterium]